MSGFLTIVSGKGGVGKTVVAAALAKRYAENGQRTLLVELAGSGSRHPILKVTTKHAPHQVADNLSVAHIDARLALRDFLSARMTFSGPYVQLLNRGPVRRFLDALPVFDELMCMARLHDLVSADDAPWDQVVFDGPATGHCRTLLNVPQVASSLLLAGPIQRSARDILDLLTDVQRARLLLVSLPEDTPVRETLELAGFCREQIGLRCDELVINRCFAKRFTRKELKALASAAESEPGCVAYSEAAAAEAGIARQQDGCVRELSGAFDHPVLVPHLHSKQRHDRIAALLAPLTGTSA